MKLKKHLVLIGAILLLASFLVGCNQKVSKTTFTLYFPYDTGTDFAIKEVAITKDLTTDEDKLQTLAQLLKTTPENETVNPVFGTDVEFIKVEVTEDQIVHAELNRAFISQMNAGGRLEEQIIQSLVNTLCNFYQAKGVLLRVEGHPYESGHIAFGPDEVLYPQ